MDNTYDYYSQTNTHSAPSPATPRSTGKASFLSKVGFNIFLAALFLFPFAFIPLPGWDISVGKVILSAVLVLAAGILLFGDVHTKKISIPRTYSFLLLGSLVFAGLSVVFSLSPAESFFGQLLGVGTFYTLAIGAAFAFLIPLILSSREKITLSIMTLLAGGGVLLLFHLLRMVIGPEFLSFGGFFDSGISTPIGSWGDLSVFFLGFYILSLGLASLSSLSSTLKIGLRVFAILSLFFVFLINSMSLLIVAIGASLAIAGLSFVSKKDMFPLVPLFIIIPVFLYSLTPFGGSLLSNVSATITGVQYTEVRPGFSSEMVVAGFSSVKNTFLGSGPGTYMYHWQQHRQQEYTNSDFWSFDFPFSFGIIPTFATTHGLLFTLVLLAFIGYMGVVLVRVVLKGISDKHDNKSYALTAVTGIPALSLWILSFFYVFGTPVFLLAFVLSGMFIASLLVDKRLRTIELGQSSASGSLYRYLAVGVLVALLVPAAVLSVSKTLYGSALVEAYTTEDIQGIESAQEKLRIASLLEMNDAYIRAETELILFKIQYLLVSSQEEDIDEATLTAQLQVLINEIGGEGGSVERAKALGPNNYLNYLNAGLVYETLGVLGVPGSPFEVAADNYAQAQRLNPTNPELILVQARLEMAREDTERARSFVNASIALKENFINSYLLLADIELSEQNKDAAVASLERAMVYAPTDPGLPYQIGIIHYQTGDYDEAIESFSEALTLAQDFENARFFRALAFVYGAGNTADALKDLESLTQTNPDNELLNAVVLNIREGRDPSDGLIEETEGLMGEEGDISTNNRDIINTIDENQTINPELPLGSETSDTGAGEESAD